MAIFRSVGRVRMFVLLVLLGTLSLALTSCVELTGQRISIHYDAGSDTLTALLFYDGVHNSKDSPEDGEKNLEDFVKGGDVMFFDWFLHITRSNFQQTVDDVNASPKARILARLLLDNATVTPLGRYRDAEDRMGGAQMIRITHASGVVAAANAAINESQIDSSADYSHEEDFPRSRRAMVNAARANHKWITLGENALSVSIPIDNREWAVMKMGVIAGGARELADPDQMSATWKGLAVFLRMFSSTPLSITESPGQITVTLGSSDDFSTLRFVTDREYAPNLEEALTKLVPADLDKVMTQELLHPEQKASDRSVDYKAIMGQFPPEYIARLLYQASVSEDSDVRKAARPLLAQWATAWNWEHGVPYAPTLFPDDPHFLAAWNRWYVLMIHFPLEQGSEGHVIPSQDDIGAYVKPESANEKSEKPAR